MNTGVFDLTGTKRYYLGQSLGKSDFKVSTSIRLSDLLIYPTEEESNRQPYLQDYASPSLEDLHRGGMAFNYDSCHYLADMLKQLDDDGYKQLNDYFYYQNGLLVDAIGKQHPPVIIDTNILLVSDDCDGEKQEKILRACHFPRNKTFLLWRSVAAFLGAKDFLTANGAQDGDNVAVVDEREGHVFVSMLKIKKEKTFLVPCRKSFSHNNNYPVWNYNLKVSVPDNEETKFWKHTYNCPGRWVVPSKNGWKEQDFPVPTVPEYVIPQTVAKTVNFCIAIGNIKVTCQNDIPKYQANREDIATGAGRFAVRQANGLPTYYDQCEPLIFIIQDSTNETIVPIELIKGNELCKGGAKIIGEINKDFYLEQENHSISFLLNVGNVNSQTPLKELIHDFGFESNKIQPLILHPSMIPGQGIAQVEVEAHPLLAENVLLDFLKMHPSNKTIASLEEDIPRSFPIDIPDVEASIGLWDKQSVSTYLDTGIVIDSGMFAKTIWPYSKCKGIERFRRINVFGTNPDNRVPNVGELILQRLFNKIAKDYQNSHFNGKKKNDFIRMAAWTYQKDNPLFASMISDTMERMRLAVHSTRHPFPQEFTLCANMLSHQQQGEFIDCFIKRCIEVIRAVSKKTNSFPEITGVDSWIRAVFGLLMYNSDALKDVSTETCNKCAVLLYIILTCYHRNEKSVQYVKRVISSLLFLLKRRKYDKSFLKDGENKQMIIDECNLIREDLFYQDIHTLCKSLIDFMNGKGTLEGIPAGNDELQ